MNQLTLRVRDLGLAAALVSCDFEMQESYQDKNGRAYFVFIQTDELSHAVNDYWADTLDVKARKFSDNLKMLKSRIYAER